MQFPTSSSPFTPVNNTVNRIMLQVLLALIPAISLMFWLFGRAFLMQLLLACSTALLAEACMLWLRKKPIKMHLLDLSALVSAVLLALAIPTIAPWWISVSGTLFAIIIAKHLYGGLGYNPFNPAMAGYVFLLISFPQQMTAWQLPFDVISSATVLDHTKTQLGLGFSIGEISTSPLFGYVAGKDLEYLSLAYLFGGLWLLQRKVISWHIPVAVLLGLTFPAFIAYLIDSTRFTSPLFHLFSGATLCCAFFIATDPVTAATSNKGRLIFGLLIGSLIYLIRTWGGYPDAIAFAVLLANLAAPSIDYYTRPKRVKQP
ncbi:MAG: RnfABCDGE type electron transport complex subunit D [Methylococcaceae bacterium]|nr:RnfABCDGE type electron transport complex subunit D [Methylococcaceae bacterium]